VINPSKLKALRKARNWTQQRLHEESDVDVQTISRIESGKVTRPNSHTVDRLATALDVTPLELSTADLRLPEANVPSAEQQAISQFNVRLGNAKRNAFTLVSERYGVPYARIVELAPMFFVWAAEESLKRRSQALNGIIEGLEACQKGYSALPHMESDGESRIDESVNEELSSISHRDIFAQRSKYRHPEDVGYFDERTPFVKFLKTIAEQTEGISAFEWIGSDYTPDYRIADWEALERAGGDQEVADAIVAGKIALHEIPRELRGKKAASAQAAWMRSELDRQIAIEAAEKPARDALIAEILAQFEDRREDNRAKLRVRFPSKKDNSDAKS
jgi:transcriptional regulator with XRE-family HTH domain